MNNMREVKFRVYDKEAGAIVEHDQLLDDFNMSYLLGHPEEEGFVLMQYTGRKDRRDREIYEGDIVIIPEHYSGDNLCREYRAVITYNAPEFQTEPYFDESWNDIEVIGNIYENPELLEGGV